MALPADVGVFTLQGGAFTDVTGATALAGMKGTLQPVDGAGRPMNVIHSASGKVIVPISVPIEIQSDGTWSLGPLPYTNDPALAGAFRYKVSWNVAGSAPSPGNKIFEVPTGSGSTVDFDLLGSSTGTVVTPVAVPLVTSVVGKSGAVTGSDIAADPAVQSAIAGGGTPYTDANAVSAVEAATSVAPTGAWNFSQTPTVNGTALGSGGGGSASPATTTTEGIVQLAGDLGGTATAPTVTGGTHHGHTASQISDSTAVGRSVLTAADAPTARTAIGAGTSSYTPPSQTGNAGKFLTTDGTTTSWGTPAGGRSGSGLPSTVVSKTAAYTAAVGDFVEADATTAAFTVTLPSAPAVGALVAVKKVDATANTLTIAPAGSGNIDGDPNATTVTQWAGAIFEHLGSDVWRIVASMTTTGPAGPAGPTGADGAAATVTVGSTTTGAAGTSASVTNSGTSSAAVLDFTIPQGAAGADGADGQGVPVGGASGQILAKNSATDYDTHWINAPTGGGGSVTVEDEGTALTVRSTINFVGAGVTATDDAANSRTVVTIPGGGGGGGGGFTQAPTIARLHIPVWIGGGTAITAPVAGQVYGLPIYLPAGHVTRLFVPNPGSTNVAGTVRMGIYTLDTTTPPSSALLLDAGTVDANNSSANLSIVINQAVTEGWYVLAIKSNESRNLKCVTNANGFASQAYSIGGDVMPGYGWLGSLDTTGTAFGATLGGTGTVSNIIPIVGVEMAA